MGKWRDKVFFVSSTFLRREGMSKNSQPRERILLRPFAKHFWIVVEQPMNMDGFLVVEQTPQGEWIAATIAFLRWVLRIYGWIVCGGFRLYDWVYGKIPRPDPYGTIRMPFTSFWSCEGIHWIDDEQRRPQAPTGAILNGGNQIRWPVNYTNPEARLDPEAERQYWYGGELTNARPRWMVDHPVAASDEQNRINGGDRIPPTAHQDTLTPTPLHGRGTYSALGLLSGDPRWIVGWDPEWSADQRLRALDCMAPGQIVRVPDGPTSIVPAPPSPAE